jgi:hypothetical protein
MQMGKRAPKEFYVEIRDIKTRKVEKRMGPFKSEGHAAQCERGMNINLDHTRFFTNITTKKP